MGRKPKQPTGLKAMLGNKWRITMDESWQYEEHTYREANRVWYEQVKVRGGGHLSLHDLDNKLFCLWTKRYKVASEVAAEFPELGYVKYDKEADLIIPLYLVDTILEKFHGSKRKVMSAEWREKSANRMREYQAKKRAEKETQV
jgi:hypothetical protein